MRDIITSSTDYTNDLLSGSEVTDVKSPVTTSIECSDVTCHTMVSMVKGDALAVTKPVERKHFQTRLSPSEAIVIDDEDDEDIAAGVDDMTGKETHYKDVRSPLEGKPLFSGHHHLAKICLLLEFKSKHATLMLSQNTSSFLTVIIQCVYA